MKASASEIFKGVAILVIGAILSQIGTRIGNTLDEQSAIVSSSQVIMPNIFLNKSCKKLKELDGDISKYSEFSKKFYTENTATNYYSSSEFDIESMCKNNDPNGYLAYTLEIHYRNESKNYLKDVYINAAAGYIFSAYSSLNGRDYNELIGKNGQEFLVGDILPGNTVKFTGYSHIPILNSRNITITNSSNEEIKMIVLQSVTSGIYTNYIKSDLNIILLVLFSIVMSIASYIYYTMIKSKNRKIWQMVENGSKPTEKLKP